MLLCSDIFLHLDISNPQLASLASFLPFLGLSSHAKQLVWHPHVHLAPRTSMPLLTLTPQSWMPLILSFTFPPYHSSWVAPSQLIRLSSNNSFPEPPQIPPAGVGPRLPVLIFCVERLWHYLPHHSESCLRARTISFHLWICRATHITGTFLSLNSVVLINETLACPVSVSAPVSELAHSPAGSTLLKIQLDSCIVQSSSFNIIITTHALCVFSSFQYLSTWNSFTLHMKTMPSVH